MLVARQYGGGGCEEIDVTGIINGCTFTIVTIMSNFDVHRK